MAVNIGPRIGIDGEAEYRKQLNNIIQQQKTLSAEMRATESVFDKNASAQERASAKAASLTKQIDLQRQRVEMASKMVEESAKAYGEADDKTLKWKQVLADATTDLNKLEAELRDTVDVILDTGDGFEASADNIDEASRALDDSVGAADRASDGWSAFGAVIANLATDIFRKAIDGVKEFASGMVEAAAEVQASNAQFSQTFGELEGQADAMVKSIADSTGILDTRLRDSASGVYAFARSSGASTEEAMALTDTALRAAADAAAYYDMSLEEATEKLQSFLKGNMSNDAALGVSATETTRNAAAMELFGQKFNDLTEIQKQQTLLKMVTDAQELSGAMGQAARESDGWANVTGNLQEAWKQLQAEVGAPALQALVPVVKDVTAGFQDFSDKVFPKIRSAFDWIKKNPGTLKIAIVGLGAALVAYNWVSIVMGISSAVVGLAGAVKAFGAALASNPVGLIILGITAVVTAIKLLWDNCEEFRTAVTNIWNAIKDAFDSVVEWFRGKIESFKSSFSGLGASITSAKDSIVGSWTDLKTKTAEAWSNIKGKIEENGGGIKGVVTTIGDELARIWTGAFTAIDEATGGKLSSALSTVSRILTSISDTFTSILGGARDKVKEIIDKIVGFFDIDISFPKIPLPHFSISPKGWKVGDLLEGSIPKLSIDWYRKAYDDPIIFNRPTVLPTVNGLKGFGDGPGAEVVIGMNRLQELLAENAARAVQSTGSGFSPQIYVYAQPGQDVSQIADEVMQRMQYEINRRVS